MILRYFSHILVIAMFLAGPWVQAQVDSQRVLVHFPGADGGFQGELVLNNPSNLSKTITLVCYSMDGKYLSDVEVDMKPKELVSLAVENLLPKGTSHAIVKGSVLVSLGVSYRATTTGTAARSMVTEVKSQGGEVKLLPSFDEKNQEYWEGAAVVCLGDSPGVIMVDTIIDGIKGPPGHAFTCEPMEKKIFVFSDLFGESVGSTPFYYRITSDQPFAAIGLAGTTDHRVLWPVNPMLDNQYPKNEFSELSVPDIQVDSYKVLGLELVEEFLEVEILYPDYCPETLHLFMSGGFMESLPVQVNLTFQRVVDSNVNCIQILRVENHHFDLSPLVQDFLDSYGEGVELQINFKGLNDELIAHLKYQPYKP